MLFTYLALLFLHIRNHGVGKWNLGRHQSKTPPDLLAHIDRQLYRMVSRAILQLSCGTPESPSTIFVVNLCALELLLVNAELANIKFTHICCWTRFALRPWQRFWNIRLQNS